MLHATPSFPQARSVPSSSTQSPPTLHRPIAQPIAVRILRRTAWAVASETPSSRATACAEQPAGSRHTMNAARNHLASGSLVWAIAVPLVADCQRHEAQQNSLRPDTRA